MSEQGSYQGCTWCAAKDARIADVRYLRSQYDSIVEMKDRAEATLAPFSALARAAENVLKYWGGGEMEHDYPRSQLKELRAALDSPAVQRAMMEGE